MANNSGSEALGNARGNDFSRWNLSEGSANRSENPADASRRILDGYAALQPDSPPTKLDRNSAVFTMGSCFAREIEAALTRRGGNVVSISKEALDHPAFRGPGGDARSGYLHRFTPRAMLHEFQMAFDRLPAWDPGESLLFPTGAENVEDLNYWTIGGADQTREATLARRSIARDLVRTAAEARIIILTLGLTESWFHIPSGFYVNRVAPNVLVRNAKDFRIEFARAAEVLETLEEMYTLLSEVAADDVQIVVTVSPVPLQSTFSAKDIIVANQDSKASLRAAAAQFAESHDNVTYFPSFEMVMYSNPDLAWRPDRVHVNPGMVGHIVETFVRSYYEPDALPIQVPKKRA